MFTKPNRKEVTQMTALEIKRRNAGLSIAELAQKSGVSAPTIVKIEAGRIVPVKVDTLQKLADALNCTVADFL
jgi:transcriptional regulator with XRE-family HTH domain